MFGRTQSIELASYLLANFQKLLLGCRVPPMVTCDVPDKIPTERTIASAHILKCPVAVVVETIHQQSASHRRQRNWQLPSAGAAPPPHFRRRGVSQEPHKLQVVARRAEQPTSAALHARWIVASTHIHRARVKAAVQRRRLRRAIVAFHRMRTWRRQVEERCELVRLRSSLVTMEERLVHSERFKNALLEHILEARQCCIIITIVVPTLPHASLDALQEHAEHVRGQAVGHAFAWLADERRFGETLHDILLR